MTTTDVPRRGPVTPGGEVATVLGTHVLPASSSAGQTDGLCSALLWREGPTSRFCLPLLNAELFVLLGWPGRCVSWGGLLAPPPAPPPHRGRCLPGTGPRRAPRASLRTQH